MIRYKLPFALLLALATTAGAEEFTMDYSVGLEANAGSGDFAPYYISSLRQGTVTAAKGVSLNVAAWRPLDMSKRFSYSFGVEAQATAANSADYERWNKTDKEWYTHSERPSMVMLNQLWGQIKYRGVYLTAGLRNQKPPLVNPRLSSGDLVESGNARAMPGVRVGFIDFQNIPFTNGWVQIQGDLGYYKSTDNGWQKSHYNYWNYHLNLGWWYNYKRCFFRTKPSQPFSVTVGMQAAAQFAGTNYSYVRGEFVKEEAMGGGAKEFFHMLIPAGGDDFWKGNHVGSWDFNARYRFDDNSEVKAYFQWLWEDGSGIGKLNGWDGLWGLEWKAAEPGAISGAVLEAVTFMNHSGHIHYVPNDHKGTDFTHGHTDGADNYYNNTWYNGYAYYGMGIGSPMFPSPIYNTDGATTRYLDNRFWGVHGGIEGQILPELSYRVLASYRRFYGTPFLPAINTTHDVSAMVEASWSLPQVPGLNLTAQLAFDKGNSHQYGNKFGALISATYSGIFNFKKAKFNPCVLSKY